MDPEPSSWPGWVGGLALAGVPLAYFLVFARLLPVSGRYSLLINRLRFGAQEGPEDEVDDEAALAEALRAATVEAFGVEAVAKQLEQQAAVARPSRHTPLVVRSRPVSLLGHAVFLIALGLGGRLAAPLSPVQWSLGDVELSARLPPEALPWALLAAGVLVGFGTRMAGGCTVGHGLCGVPRLQAGSLLTTATMFAAGACVAWLLAAGGS